MLDVLISYAYMTDDMLRIVSSTQGSIRWLLDSGAFTAHEQGRVIEVRDYCDFLHQHGHLFWQTIGLDKVGNAAVTRSNLAAMRADGLNPMPVLTVDEDARDAPALLGDACKHLCVAGGVTEPVERYGPRLALLRRVLGPDVWLHGLGFSRGPSVARTTVDSVDSSTWLAGKRWGQLVWFDPRTARGFGNVGWKECLTKPWREVPEPARQAIVSMGLQPQHLGTHDMARGAFSALSMQSVHAFMRFREYLRQSGKVYYFAVTNVQDTYQLLMAAKHSTARGLNLAGCLSDVARHRAAKLDIAQLAAEAAANLIADQR